MPLIKIFLLVTVVLVAALSNSVTAQVLAVHAGGNAADNSGALSSLNLETGDFTVLGEISNAGGVSGLATDGTVWYATLGGSRAGELVTLDPSDGAIVTTIGVVTLTGGGTCAIGDLAMGEDGTLYGITANATAHVCDGAQAGTILTIDTQTAAATVVGRPMESQYGKGADNVNGGLAVDGDGNLWLSPGWNHPDPGNFYIIDTSTGLIESTLTLTGPLAGTSDGPNGLMWNPADGLLYASWVPYTADSKSLWSVDPTTGASLLITATADAFHDLAAPPLPEPPPPVNPPSLPVPALPIQSLLLLGGLLGLFGLRKLNH